MTIIDIDGGTNNSSNTTSSTDWIGWKERGTQAFNRADYDVALQAYAQATHQGNNNTGPSTLDRQILLSNMVACRLKLGGKAQAEAAVVTAKKCIALNDKWAKAHVRLGSAYIMLGGEESTYSNDACNALQLALQLSGGNNPTARDMLVRELRSRDRRHNSSSNSSSSTPFHLPHRHNIWIVRNIPHLVALQQIIPTETEQGGVVTRIKLKIKMNDTTNNNLKIMNTTILMKATVYPGENEYNFKSKEALGGTRHNRKVSRPSLKCFCFSWCYMWHSGVDLDLTTSLITMMITVVLVVESTARTIVYTKNSTEIETNAINNRMIDTTVKTRTTVINKIVTTEIITIPLPPMIDVVVVAIPLLLGGIVVGRRRYCLGNIPIC